MWYHPLYLWPLLCHLLQLCLPGANSERPFLHVYMITSCTFLKSFAIYCALLRQIFRGQTEMHRGKFLLGTWLNMKMEKIWDFFQCSESQGTDLDRQHPSWTPQTVPGLWAWDLLLGFCFVLFPVSSNSLFDFALGLTYTLHKTHLCSCGGLWLDTHALALISLSKTPILTMSCSCQIWRTSHQGQKYPRLPKGLDFYWAIFLSRKRNYFSEVESKVASGNHWCN